MIRTKGEAGTGNIVNAVTPHARGLRAASAGCGALREDELYAEAKELRAPLELVRWVAEHGTPAGGHLHRRRHRDARGRGALHAARRRRRLRRLGHLQVGRPGAPREGDRRGDDALRGRRGARRASPPGSASRWSASPPPRSAPRSCWRRAAGERGGNGRFPPRAPFPESRLDARPAQLRLRPGKPASAVKIQGATRRTWASTEGRST